MKSQSQYLRSMARGGALAVAGKAMTYPIALLLAIVLARVLTPEELGGYFLATSLILITATVVQFGAGPVMVKFVGAALAVGDAGRARQTLVMGAAWIATMSLFAFIALWAGVGPWLFGTLHDGEMLKGLLTLIAVLVVAYAAISFLCEVLRSFSDLGSASLFAEQLLQRFLLLILLVAALWVGLELDLSTVFGLMVVSAVATALIGIVFVWSKFRSLDRVARQPVTANELLRQAPPFFFMRLNFWLMDTAPVWILGMFHPSAVVALYGVGNLLALIVLAPWMVVSTSLGPAVVKLHAEQRTDLLRMVLGTVGGIATLGAAGVVLVLVVFGKQILAVVFAESLTPAYGTAVILGLGRGISVLFGSPALVLSMTQHQMTVLRVLLVSGVIGLALYFAAARLGSIELVALTGALLAISQNAILAISARRLLGISTLSTFRRRDWREFRNQILHRQ